MRVLFVCGADFRAPTEKVILGFALGLVERGWEVLVSVGGDAATVAGEAGESLPDGLEVRSHRFAGPRLRRRDREAAARFAPDVVYAATPRVPTLRAATQMAAAAGAPVAVRFEDDEWGLSGDGSSGSLPRRALKRLAKLTSPLYPPLWPFSTAGSMRWVRDNACGLDAITPELAAEVERQIGRPCAVVLPVRPRDDFERIDSVEPALPPELAGRKLVAFTGAVFAPHEPDFRLGLRAVALLQERGVPVSFAHCGSAAPRFDLRAWAAEAGLAPDSVALLGYLPVVEALGLLRAADVLVQPGRPSEFNRLRLPSKLQTYLASGTPTVTFAVGAGELLADRVEVLKTYGDTPEELADRVEEALNDPALRRALSEGGPQAAQRLFDRDRNSAALARHLEESLQRDRSDGGG